MLFRCTYYWRPERFGYSNLAGPCDFLVSLPYSLHFLLKFIVLGAANVLHLSKEVYVLSLVLVGLLGSLPVCLLESISMSKHVYTSCSFLKKVLCGTIFMQLIDT